MIVPAPRDRASLYVDLAEILSLNREASAYCLERRLEGSRRPTRGSAGR